MVFVLCKLVFTSCYVAVVGVALVFGVGLGSGLKGPVIARKATDAERYWVLVGFHMVFFTVLAVLLWTVF